MEPVGKKPDIIILGKAISGGVTPVSGIFADRDVMSVIGYGDHGSTFGGNPLGMATAKAAIETLLEEGMVENSHNMGQILGKHIRSIKSPVVKDARGKGLMQAIEICNKTKVDGNDFVDILRNNGLLTKAGYNYIVRFTPALVIDEPTINQVCEIVSKSVKELEQLNEQRLNQ